MEELLFVPAAASASPAPTVVLFLEGGGVAALRNAVSALLSAGRSVRVLAQSLPPSGQLKRLNSFAGGS
jgi:hypothetical protein